MPGGRGNRYMYYATGQPGWMRFGYSPGWVGRSATGLGPCAEYITTGRWQTPQMQACLGKWRGAAGWSSDWCTSDNTGAGAGYAKEPSPGIEAAVRPN